MNEEVRRQILSACNPLINSGTQLNITVEQDLRKGSKDYLNLEGPATVKLKIEGPQTSIDANFISGVFPAAGSEETPDEFLPHIALSRRTLPWERDGIKQGDPWMALLLVRKSEMDTSVWKRRAYTKINRSGRPTIDPDILLPKGAKGSLEKLKVSDVLSRDSKAHAAFTTKLKLAGSQEIFVAFIPNGTMSKIMPQNTEVPLLCCMKRAEKKTETKATVIEDTAIVICNRLPDAGNGTSPPEEHTALLVSFEGRQDLVESNRFADQSKTTALIVLHHWTFTPSGEGDFEELMRAISLRPNGGVLRFGNLPKDAPPAGLSGGFESVLDVHGYFKEPLEHEQEGPVAFRGPLRPFPAGARSAGYAVRAAPEEFDDTPGSDDYSHAAAFELGRLLALADAGILEEMREIQGTVDKLPLKEWVNQLPPALQRPDWVQQENPQWYEQPWEMPGKTLWKSEQIYQQQHGFADVTGIEMLGAQWKQNALDPLTSGPVTQIEQVFDIDVTAIDIDVIEKSFGDIVVKGMP